MRNSRRLVVPGLAVALALLLLAPARPAAHEIPNDAKVLMIVRPAGQRLQMLIRVPMASTADTIKWPTTDAGYLDIANADATMRVTLPGA